jgi:hypothetical protein
MPKGSIPNDEFTTEPVWVPLKLISTNPAGYQRLFDEARAKKLARDWDPTLYNPMKLSPDGNGGYYVWDGQHRFGALEILGATGAWCLISNKNTREQAGVFRTEQRARKPLSAFDDFHAGLVEGDEFIHMIQGVLKHHGLNVPRKASSSRGDVNAVVGLRTVARHGSDHLNDVLLVLGAS